MKRFEIWAEFPDGCEAKIESWKSLKQASWILKGVSK